MMSKKTDVPKHQKPCGPSHLGHLTITVTPTSTGVGTFVQIMSDAAMPVNIVLIADQVDIQDTRHD